MSASGGVYSGENAAFDFQVPWLRNMLGFLGMTDVEVIRIEGTAFGPEAADEALERATVHARDLVGADRCSIWLVAASSASATTSPTSGTDVFKLTP